MKFGTAIGLAVSALGLIMGAIMEGSNPMVVLNVPAILIVLVGTLGAVMAACGLPAVLKIPKLCMTAFMPPPVDLVGRVHELVGFAEKARRDVLLALDEALKLLTEKDERKGRVVELRFFGGLTVDEAAAVLNVSRDTVLRDWQLAKAWLHRALGPRRP